MELEMATTGCGGNCGCSAPAPSAPELDVRTIDHALRRGVVLGAVAGLGSGESLVLVAPHDPLPMLALIEAEHPGEFTVNYLDRGPEQWRLQLTRG